MHLPPDISYRLAHLNDVEGSGWQQVLSAPEQARLATFRHERRWKEFVAGRLAARTLAAERLNLSPAAVPLTVAEDGAIELPQTHLFVSITHSGEYAAAAVAERPVGIDLERIVQRRPDLCRRILNEEELQMLDSLGLPRGEAEILCWSIKEAVLKGRRTGFRESPRRLSIVLDLDAAAATVHHDQVPERWNACFHRVQDLYLTVAYRVT